jgi:1,4-alpha-glucan branching enzyme
MPLPPFTAPTPLGGMGATLQNGGGCVYRAWAPTATSVLLGGDFFNAGNTVPIDWQELPMARDPAGDTWSIHVPGALADSLYKFKINNPARPAGANPYRHDPYARDATGFGGNSVVVDRDFDWSGDNFQMPGWNELVLYELHIGTFNHIAGEPVGTFDQAVGKLAYLADLGINAIELMPAFDFDTDTSMGYNTALPFAVDNAYGRTQTMKQFVRAAHRLGIAVILDVVYNHWGPAGLDDCLGTFDGSRVPGKQGIYFYQDFRSFTPYADDDRPDYGRGEVRQFIRDNAMTCLDEFRFDGLRLDSTIAMRRAIGRLGDSGDIPDGFTLLRYLGEEKRKASPWKLLIAEDLQNDDVITRDALFGGMGLDAQWDGNFVGTLRDMLLAPNDAARQPSQVAAAVGKWYNQSGPFQRITYVESHDQAKFRRLVDQVAPGQADGWLARKISALGAALTLTSPGIPMLFMGQEFLDYKPWNDGRDFALDFSRVGTFGKFVDLYRRLIRLRRNFDNNTRGLRGGMTHVFWASDADGVLAWHRWDQGGPGDDVIVVANLRNQVYPSYNIGFPRGGTWYLRFNGDDRAFSDDFGNTGYDTTATWGGNQGMPFNGNVGLGPYSVCIYSQ